MYSGGELIRLSKEEFLERMLKIEELKKRQKLVKEKNCVKKKLYLNALNGESDDTDIILYAKERFSKKDYRDIMNFYMKVQIEVEGIEEW